MERRSGLKERLSRMFRPSTLLRSSCNSTSATSIFSSSTAVTSKRTTTTTATADIALDPFFNIPRRPTVNDYLINSFLGDSVDLSLPFLSADDADRPRHRAPPPLPPRLSVGCGAACQANGPEWGERPATVTRKNKKKKERRVRESGGLYETGAREGRVCPPVSPSTPFIGFHDGKKNINTTKKKKKKLLLSNGYGFSTSSSAETEEDQVGLFSSDKEGADREEETETFFSSDSSEFYQRPSSKNRRKKKKKPRKKALEPESSGFRPVVAVSKEEEEDGGGGFPVMKRSRDPYADFRSSMVEMIIERQIFGAAELERLLRAYLSLNCPRHHPVILRAFADIWEVLSGH